MVYKSKSLNSKKQKNKNKSGQKTGEPKKSNLKERVTEMLELPKEIVLNMPKLTMLGTGDLIIENYKGIVEYDEGLIRVNTTSGIIKVSGTRIFIKEITLENILIYGDISSLEFVKAG